MKSWVVSSGSWIRPPGRRADRRLALRPAMSAARPRPDHELMLAVRGGDLDCLGELFARHHRNLFGFLYKLTGSRVGAEDLAQTVFQRMLKYRHSYRDTGSFTAWMYHLARRCAADDYRKTQAAPRGVDPAELTAHADTGPQPADLIAASEDQALVQAALLQLDAESRAVLLLSRIQELSFVEVAEVLGCSVGTARVRAHRALHALRARFFELQQTRPS